MIFLKEKKGDFYNTILNYYKELSRSQNSKDTECGHYTKKKALEHFNQYISEWLVISSALFCLALFLLLLHDSVSFIFEDPIDLFSLLYA